MELTMTLQYISVFNFLLIAALIFLMKRKVKVPVIIFSFFLAGKGITLLSNILLSEITEVSTEVLFGVLLNSFLFFYAPFLYFFAKAITSLQFNFKRNYLHFIPFIIYAIFNITQVFLFKLNIKSNTFSSFALIFNEIVAYAYYIQVFSYTFFALKTIKNLNFEYNHQYKTVQFLKSILLLFIIIWFVFFIHFAINNYFQNPNLSNNFKFIGILLLLILSNLTLVFMVKNPEVFFLQEAFETKKNKTQNKFINEANYKKICDLMFEKELYKNPNFKVVELSELTGISSRNTSAIIKSFHGTNFYDFVNSYRIEEAKKLLKTNNEELTILKILYDAGFNSKSVFNAAFKKKEGVTPSEFKKNMLHF
ncbi:helix-turn-helix domain-containing protein [Lutibacter aestuarii]|uniref:Helix-turn-helix domain-containing protein n=3 Tax=Lutibacter TaxID=358023 RepID=A0ABW2Z8A8_9FLAO